MAAQKDRPIWLSGEILTFLNKIVFPALWLGIVGGLPLTVLIRTGGLSIAKGFGFIVVFALVSTAWLLWLSTRLERVGYCGTELVVANYWREARIPFNQVESVEPVWWYWRRLVRVRFRGETPFGRSLYYIPKWAVVRCLFAAPEDELRRILADANPVVPYN